ncbi:MAG: hypothetical protein ABI868_02940 [Acidobacteriota bacterium]
MTYWWINTVLRTTICIAGAVLAMAMASSAAGAFALDGTSHIHVSDRILKGLIERGMAGSETFQSVVAQVDAAPIVVFVNCDLFMPTGLGGRLHFMSTVGRIRYVRVALRCTLPSSRQLSMLAHELQHALEIAGNPAIEDADSMESYYEEAGFATYSDGTHRGFETDAAIAVQRRVYRELTAPSRSDERNGQPASAE